MRNVSVTINKEASIKNSKSFDNHIINIVVKKKYEELFSRYYNNYSNLDNVSYSDDISSVDLNSFHIVVNDVYVQGLVNFHFGSTDGKNDEYFIVDEGLPNLACFLALYCNLVYSRQDFSVSPSFLPVPDVSGLSVFADSPLPSSLYIIKDGSNYCLYGDKNIKGSKKIHECILDLVIRRNVAFILGSFRSSKCTDYTKINIVKKLDGFFNNLKNQKQIKSYFFKNLKLDSNNNFKIYYKAFYYEIMESLSLSISRES